MAKMFVFLWVGDEGPTDIDLKDGDIFRVERETWQDPPIPFVPSSAEKKGFLILKMDEYQNSLSELVEPEPGAGGIGTRHMRKYRIPYWLKLTPDQLSNARNKTVEVEPIENTFDVWDIERK
jgi:hypothetical protein